MENPIDTSGSNRSIAHGRCLWYALWSTALTLALTGYVLIIGSQSTDRFAPFRARDSTRYQRDINDWVEYVLEAEAALQTSKALVSEGRFEDARDLIENQVNGVLLDDQAQSELRYLDVRIKNGLKMQSEQHNREVQRQRKEWMSRNEIN